MASRLNRPTFSSSKAFNIVMNDAYIPFLSDDTRFHVIRGGSGSGKSVYAADKTILNLLTQAGRNTLVIRKVAKTNRVSTFPLILNRLSELGALDRVKINKSDMRIHCLDTNNEIIFEGMDDAEKIKSITFASGPLTDIWMEEATEFEENDYVQLNLRLRGKGYKFQMTLTFNPISVGHWIKQVFFDRIRNNVRILTTTYKDNKFLDPAYAAELESLQHTNPILYQVYCLGEWGEAGDIVFSHVRFEKCPYTEKDFDEVLIGMDFGYNHYHAIEKIGMKDGRLYSFKEYYVRQKTNSTILREVADEKTLTMNDKIIADSAEPKSIKDWEDAGYRRIRGAKKGPDSVYAQIQYLRAHEWIIDPEECPGLAAEVRGYVYHKDKNGKLDDREPIGFHDDAIAACRYAIEEKLTPANKARVAKVRVA